MILDREVALKEKVVTGVDFENEVVTLHASMDWMDTMIAAMNEEPRKSGKWILQEYTTYTNGVFNKEQYYVCSNCNEHIPVCYGNFKYCPECGCKMEG